MDVMLLCFTGCMGLFMQWCISRYNKCVQVMFAELLSTSAFAHDAVLCLFLDS